MVTIAPPSPQEVETALDNEFRDRRNTHINEARSSFRALKAGHLLPSEGLFLINDNLKKAGVSASALDPDGKKTATEMEREVNGAVKTVYLNQARDLINGLKANKLKMHADAALSLIRDYLKSAGSADPELNKKNAGELEKVLEIMELANKIENKQEMRGQVSTVAINIPRQEAAASPTAKPSASPGK